MIIDPASDSDIENYRKLFTGIDVTGNLRQVAASDEWISASMADTSKCRVRVPLRVRLGVILRWVARAIAMTLTTDNCGCERLISLMSDLQRLIMQAPPDTAASRAKLNYMRTFADCRYAFKLVKKGAMKAPQEIPSLLKKGETGGFPSHLPRKRWDGKIFRPTYPGGTDFWLSQDSVLLSS